MDLLTYSCPPNLERMTAKAAAIWNGILRDLVALRKWQDLPPGISSTAWTAQPDISIAWLNDVQIPGLPDRVAYCKRVGPSRWIIALDSTRKWAITPWQRFWGNGEDVLACLVHELGHVFKLPHASDQSFVMHPQIGGNGKIGRREAELYRNQFLKVLEGER